MNALHKMLTLFLTALLSLSLNATMSQDSLLNVIKTGNTVIVQLNAKLKADSISKADTIKKLQAQIPAIGECRSCEINWIEKLLVVLPAALFLCLAFYFLRWLKREKFRLSDALSADVPTSFSPSKTTIKDVANSGSETIKETQEPNYPNSSSRLIAFLTSISAIVIALSLITYYAYGYITKAGNMTNLDGLWKIVAGLGIGVVPYIAKTIKGEPPPADK